MYGRAHCRDVMLHPVLRLALLEVGLGDVGESVEDPGELVVRHDVEARGHARGHCAADGGESFTVDQSSVAEVN
jgi:hypothetical protein